VFKDFPQRARALVGTPFRPQGRSELGLDCIGLILATFEIPTDAVRRNYRLRGDHRAELEGGLRAHFRRVSGQRAQAGDVILMAVTESQFHLGVRTAAGLVHAHAGIGRIVETPGSPQWPVIGIYRKRVR
jgi:lipoprotein Spr